MKNDKQNRINEERVCVDSLVQNLKHLHRCSDIKVHQEPKDPPDFWIDVDGIRYAVEVTSIVKDQAFHAACTSLKDVVKKRVLSQIA